MVEEKHWFKPTIILLVACLWFMHGILLPVTYVCMSAATCSGRISSYFLSGIQHIYPHFFCDKHSLLSCMAQQLCGSSGATGACMPWSLETIVQYALLTTTNCGFPSSPLSLHANIF